MIKIDSACELQFDFPKGAASRAVWSRRERKMRYTVLLRFQGIREQRPDTPLGQNSAHEDACPLLGEDSAPSWSERTPSRGLTAGDASPLLGQNGRA